MKGSDFSIRTILILSFILIAIIMTSISLVQRYIWLDRHERDKITEDYMPIAESMGKIIEMTLIRRLTLLTQVSNEVIKTGMNPERMQSIIETAHFRNPDFKTFWIGDSSGRAIAFSPRFDRQGRPNIGRDYSDREYYRKVRDEKRPFIGEIIIGRVAGEAIIPLVVPVLKEGRFEGFVFGGLDPEVVRKIIRTIRIYGMGYLTVTDEKGKAIAMSNNPQFERELKDLSSTRIFKRAQQEKKGIVEYVSLVDGRLKIGAFYGLENGWKVWVSRDIREMKSDIMESFCGALIIGIAGLFLISIFGYFLSLQISLPIRRLKDNAIALSSG
ncbi:MAG: cache domain-containing protein, partial [Thermodesulfovibrionales bacterium]